MDDYATHLPVIYELSPKRVLEFGAGLYSTKAFLSMTNLTKLVSVEVDPEWRERLRGEIQDARWTLLDGHRLPPLLDYDLILIDDGTSAQERSETIRYVLRQKHPQVVVHDAEVYLPLILEFSGDVVVHDALSPHTAVVGAS